MVFFRVGLLMVNGDVEVERAVLREIGEDEFHEHIDDQQDQQNGGNNTNPERSGQVAEDPSVQCGFSSLKQGCCWLLWRFRRVPQRMRAARTQIWRAQCTVRCHRSAGGRW